MKLFLRILILSIFIGIIYGFYHKTQIHASIGTKIIGFSVLALAFIWIPCFIYHRWKGKDVQKYMLTTENIKKMQEHQKH